MIQGIIEILSADEPFKTLVGLNAARTKPKIYWVVCPATEKTPYVVLSIASNNPNQNKDDVSTVDQTTFQAFTYTDDPEKADEIDTAMRWLIEGKNITTSSVKFQRIYSVNQQDGFDKEAQKPFRVTIYQCFPVRQRPT